MNTKEKQKITNQARKEILQEIEDEEKFQTQIEEAKKKGQEKAKQGNLLSSMWKTLATAGANVADNINRNSKSSGGRKHRKSAEPDDLLEGIL
jgi:hypothetical protein